MEVVGIQEIPFPDIIIRSDETSRWRTNVELLGRLDKEGNIFGLFASIKYLRSMLTTALGRAARFKLAIDYTIGKDWIGIEDISLGPELFTKICKNETELSAKLIQFHDI